MSKHTFLTKVATDFKSFSFRARMVTPVVKLSKSDEKRTKTLAIRR
jgi:hypothetical protein